MSRITAKLFASKSGGGGGGSGDVTGPVSSVDNSLARFNGASGDFIQGSAVILDDSGNFTGVGLFDGRDVAADGTAQDSHIADTANPHATDVANLGTGTLAELNTRITDASLDDSSASRTPTAHASGHEQGGGDEIDGDQLDIDFTPSNYTPTVAPAEVTDVNHLSAHLAGIDAAITGGGGAVDSVNGQTGTVVLDTDDVSEGVTNEYFTEARANAASAVVANTAKVSADGLVTTHSDVTSAGSGAIITAAERADIGVAIKTDESGEISALTEKGSPVSGDWVLIEDSADTNSKKKVQVGNLGVGGGGGVTDHGALTGLADDDHTQYHTAGRADTWLATKDTADVAEGTNLYYTEGRVSANSSVVANTAKVSADGLVTTHSDVTSAGSGAIITVAERADIGVAIKTDEAGEIAALTAKATPVSGDYLLIEDSADSNNKKRITVGDLPSGGGGGSSTERDTWQGSVTLSASQAWTMHSTTFGTSFYQLNQNPGANPPGDSIIHSGYFVPGGATLTRIGLLGRTNNSDVSDIELYLRARDNDLEVATALNTTTLIGSREILAATGFGIAGTSTDLRMSWIDIPANVGTAGDEDIANDSLVVPYLRTSTSIGSSRTFTGLIILEWTV